MDKYNGGKAQYGYSNSEVDVWIEERRQLAGVHSRADDATGIYEISTTELELALAALIPLVEIPELHSLDELKVSLDGSELSISVLHYFSRSNPRFLHVSTSFPREYSPGGGRMFMKSSHYEKMRSRLLPSYHPSKIVMGPNGMYTDEETMCEYGRVLSSLNLCHLKELSLLANFSVHHEFDDAWMEREWGRLRSQNLSQLEKFVICGASLRHFQTVLSYLSSSSMNHLTLYFSLRRYQKAYLWFNDSPPVLRSLRTLHLQRIPESVSYGWMRSLIIMAPHLEELIMELYFGWNDRVVSLRGWGFVGIKNLEGYSDVLQISLGAMVPTSGIIPLPNLTSLVVCLPIRKTRSERFRICSMLNSLLKVREIAGANVTMETFRIADTRKIVDYDLTAFAPVESDFEHIKIQANAIQEDSTAISHHLVEQAV